MIQPELAPLEGLFATYAPGTTATVTRPPRTPECTTPSDNPPDTDFSGETAGAPDTGPGIRRLVGILPAPVRQRLLRHRETLKFLTVGGICFMLTVAVNYALKLTVLTTKPVTALTIAIVIATIVSYVLNREWSFRTRGGRKRRHEAALFFGISGIGVLINDVPMWVARYLFHLQAPDVSQLTQEISDFISGIVLGTLLAMAFRLWALKKWAFPQQDARPATPARRQHTEPAANLGVPVPGASGPDAPMDVKQRVQDRLM